MKILLCCAAGMSTSLLVRKLQSIASRDKKAYVIKAMDQNSAELHLKNFDVVLIGPQIRYSLPRFKKIAESCEIPVEVINPTDYGRNNAEAILAFAEHLAGKKKAKLDLRNAAAARSDAGKNEQQTWVGKLNILLCGSAGMSTSLLISKMEASAKARKIDCKIWAVGSTEVNNEVEKADVLLLGPQVRSMLNQMKKVCETKGIPVDSINPVPYGLCNGEEVLNQAIFLIKEMHL